MTVKDRKLQVIPLCNEAWVTDLYRYMQGSYVMGRSFKITLSSREGKIIIQTMFLYHSFFRESGTARYKLRRNKEKKKFGRVYSS